MSASWLDDSLVRLPRRRGGGGRSPLSLLTSNCSNRYAWEKALGNVQKVLCDAQAESLRELASSTPAAQLPPAAPPERGVCTPELRRRRSPSSAASAEAEALGRALAASQREAAAAWTALSAAEAERDALARQLALREAPRATEPLQAGRANPPPPPPPPARAAPPASDGDSEGESPTGGRGAVSAQLLRLERQRASSAARDAEQLRAALCRAEAALRDAHAAAAVSRLARGEAEAARGSTPPPLPPPPPLQLECPLERMEQLEAPEQASPPPVQPPDPPQLRRQQTREAELALRQEEPHTAKQLAPPPPPPRPPDPPQEDASPGAQAASELMTSVARALSRSRHLLHAPAAR